MKYGKNKANQWRNLAPYLVRQRVIIEGTTKNIVTPKLMKEYLIQLAGKVDMEVVSGPYAYSAHEMGYGGWIHWKSSGAHIYSYPTKKPLFTVDMYTCKPFSPIKALKFTKEFFKSEEIVWKEVKIDRKFNTLNQKSFLALQLSFSLFLLLLLIRLLMHLQF